MAAAAALAWEPALEIDLRTFWPSLAVLVESVRTELQPRQVSLRGLPPNPRIIANGRPVASSFITLPGTRHIAVSAPGFRSLSLSLEIKADTVLDLPLPLALSPQRRARIAAAVWRGHLAVEDDWAAALGARLGVDHILFAVATDDIQPALLVWPQRVPMVVASAPTLAFPDVERGRSALLGWTLAQIHAPVSVGSQSTLTPMPRNHLRATLMFPAGREISLSWNNSAIRLSDEGSGLCVEAARDWPWEQGRWLGRINACLTQYILGRVESDGVSSLPTRTTGGSVLAATLIAGYAHPLWRNRIALYGQLELAVARHFLNDIEDDVGPLGLFSSYTRLGVTPFVGLRATATPLSLSAEVGYGIYGALLEQPGAIVGQPASPASLAMRMVVAYRASRVWSLAAGIEFHRLDIGFLGRGESRVSPAPRDATQSEQQLVLSLSVTRSW